MTKPDHEVVVIGAGPGMVVGPYSWSGTGWHALVEITTRHAVRAIAEARRRGATAIEVRPQAHYEYSTLAARAAASGARDTVQRAA